MSIFSFKSTDGRSISLDQLHQSSTYSGLLAGHPDTKMNEERKAAAILFFQSIFGDWPVLVMPATESPHPSKTRLGATIPLLPRIQCCGLFNTSSLDPGDDADSLLIIAIWFQETPAMPIAPEALEALSRIDWSKDAGKGYF